MECKSCGAQIADESTQCSYCQAAVTRAAGPAVATAPVSAPSEAPLTKNPPSKITAGVCGILLGALGVHKFVLGYTKAGLITLGITVLTCGYGGIVLGIIGLIEGIIYLTKSDQEFYQTYVANRKEWF